MTLTRWRPTPRSNCAILVRDWRTVRILGIDPGIGTTGWGLIEPGTDRCLLHAAGIIQTTPNSPVPGRLEVLHRELLALLDRYQPHELAIEELFFAKNVSTGIQVSHARGVILLAAAHRSIPVFEYTPPQVKQAIVGYGNAKKAQVADMLAHHVTGAQVPRQNDAADAIAVAVTHQNARHSVVATGA
ncbi:crossover junction endodeoxyribonuclease RuvC [Candidatus Berkelbacteria bacterium]|nr:crossover junction endodeoxyribonuclease RuvC [Candidatus Berkelbacteria bacterium]